jgi:hypothetical protein
MLEAHLLVRKANERQPFLPVFHGEDHWQQCE